MAATTTAQAPMPKAKDGILCLFMPVLVALPRSASFRRGQVCDAGWMCMLQKGSPHRSHLWGDARIAWHLAHRTLVLCFMPTSFDPGGSGGPKKVALGPTDEEGWNPSCQCAMLSVVPVLCGGLSSLASGMGRELLDRLHHRKVVLLGYVVKRTCVACRDELALAAARLKH